MGISAMGTQETVTYQDSPPESGRRNSTVGESSVQMTVEIMLSVQKRQLSA
jgi:hypothetical protein